MDKDKRALIVGIDHYQRLPQLSACVADARAMATLLARHDDGSRNYECRIATDIDDGPVTRERLRGECHALFDSFDGHILFYFSGHGSPTRAGGLLATADGTDRDLGLLMDELLSLATASPAKSILLLLDCCYAGAAGNPALLRQPGATLGQALLREGLTVLASASDRGVASEALGHGVFTRLALGALAGGAADVRGRVSAASLYAYVEQALGSWEQRPMYKTYADQLPPMRQCRPSVPDALLRQLPELFPRAEDSLRLAPSFEYTAATAVARHVAVFNKLKLLRNANLLATQGGRDLYFIAMHHGWVKLSPLGRFYHGLAAKGLV